MRTEMEYRCKLRKIGYEPLSFNDMGSYILGFFENDRKQRIILFNNASSIDAKFEDNNWGEFWRLTSVGKHTIKLQPATRFGLHDVEGELPIRVVKSECVFTGFQVISYSDERDLSIIEKVFWTEAARRDTNYCEYIVPQRNT